MEKFMNDYLFLIFPFFFLLSETVDVLTASISFFSPFLFFSRNTQGRRKNITIKASVFTCVSKR